MKKQKLTEAENLKINLEYSKKDIESKIQKNIIPNNPTRIFNVGDRVRFGMHKEVYIREVGLDNLYYLIESLNVVRNRDSGPKNEFYYISWVNIFPFTSNTITKIFTKKDTYRLDYINTGLDSLLHNCYSPGVEFDVEYQRDYVWNDEDKIKLLDSIFNNIDIGKFVLIRRNYSENGKSYEILDGKQRLSTLCEFFEDRFEYNGCKFSELSPNDQNTFERHPIVIGYLDNPTKEQIYEAFIKLNTCGRIMDASHIKKVENLLNELK